MLVYRLSIWSERGRIERDVARDSDELLDSIHAAGVIATGLQGGEAVVTVADPSADPAPLWIERAPSLSERGAARVRDAHAHLKEAWLLLSGAGAGEAVAHVRQGLRSSRRLLRRS